MKQKTNRDALFGLCVYDLLCKINRGLRNIDAGDVCVVDAFMSHCDIRPNCVDKYKSCDKCILEYLDKECDAD